MSLPKSNAPVDYSPDRRLSFTYDEANLLDDAGLDALCPSYIELSEVEARYQDESLVSQGAVKDVYRTFDNRAKRWVAMARLREKRGPEFYDIFVHEAWLTSSLSHPNIIKIYDVGVDSEGRPFFVMDLKGNTSLADLVGSSEPRESRELLSVFTQVCDAVAYAHSRGVLHLDLKPENIQTDKFRETLVCDWGLGKVLGEDDIEGELPDALRSLDNMTLFGQIKGTLGYMAPEQVVKGGEKDYQTDIFALGCILHSILTGFPPFLGSRESILKATSLADVVSPRKKYPDLNIPKSLDAVIMKALARSPDDRYASVSELKEEVSSYLSGYTTRAERPGFLRELFLFISRNRIPVTIAISSLILVGVLSGLFLKRIDQHIIATVKERDRGTQLEIKADSIKQDYELMIERSGRAREELARELAISGSSLKNLGIFQRPVPTVDQSHALSSLALSLDPECAVAVSEIFSLNCIKLNFMDALVMPPDFNADYGAGYSDIVSRQYIDFASAFSDFCYDRTSRPSVEQLAVFLRQAREVDDKVAPLMERILCYDLKCRGTPYYYPEDVILAFLEYINGGQDGLICRYKPQEKYFFIRSDDKLQLRIMGGGSGECVLRFISIENLNLVVAGRFMLSDLHALPIESLDISRSRKVILSKPVSLPSLREIRMRKGQLSRRSLQRFVHTTKNLKVVIVSEEAQPK